MTNGNANYSQKNVILIFHLTHIFQNSDSVKTDVYYYIFINLRPLLVTKLSESFIQERRKTLLILQHVLIDKNLSKYFKDF